MAHKLRKAQPLPVLTEGMSGPRCQLWQGRGEGHLDYQAVLQPVSGPVCPQTRVAVPLQRYHPHR